MKLKFEAATSKGSRASQDDVFFLGERPIDAAPEQTVSPVILDTDKEPIVFGVCDGVGSCSHAALGSNMAASEVQRSFYTKEDWCGDMSDPEIVKQKIANACSDASEKLSALNRSFGCIATATTISAIALKNNKMHFCCIGDSPLLLYRKHTLHPLFKPMHDGNRLLAYAGTFREPEFVYGTLDIQPGDIILLASDGIMNEKILTWALRFGFGLSAKQIVRLSTLRRYSDNCTIIKIQVEK